MRCKAPYFNSELKVFCPCGKCVACMITRRRKWTLRNILEEKLHSSSVFVTLTYSTPNLPAGGNLNPRDLQLFFKRLRKAIHPRKMRYYACGEYGERFHRPHYHFIGYGLSKADERVILKTWGLGSIDIKEVSKEAIEYVAGYCTKKFSNLKHTKGLVREFTRSSRRPAIGSGAIPYLLKNARVQLDGQDILRHLRVGEVIYPLDRYMRAKLRQAVFSPEEIELIKETYIEEMRKEARELVGSVNWLRYRDNPSILGGLASEIYHQKYHWTLETQQAKFVAKRRKKENLL